MEILILKGALAEDISTNFLKRFATTLSTKCQRLRRLDLSANKLCACSDPEFSAIVSQLTASLGINFDLRLDDDYMPEVEKKFLAIMEELIRTKGTIDHTIAHGVIVGPGRSGKDTLMKRLTGEGPPKPGTISSSTGVLEKIVKVEVKKMCTVATAVSNLEWQRLEFDEEALELIMTTTKSYSQVGSVQTPVIIKYVIQGNKSKSEELKSPPQPMNGDKKSTLTKIEEAKQLGGSESVDGVCTDEKKESSTKHVVVYRDDLAPVDIFKQAVKLRRMDALREHLESSWSLYLTNTGGQIEFQEHLPLLVCGPSIFFVVVPLHHDLDKPYEVRYEGPDGLVKKYSSIPTLMQELLQTLSTIYALDYATVQIDDEEVQLKPKVFFVGTHKDCLPGPESAREKKIKEIDKKLQNQVRQTSLFHQGSIQFAHPSKQLMMFTVNNLSQDDADFKKIRSAVQHTVEKKCYTEFTVQCPSSWLIFSLILRAKHMSDQVLQIEECFKIAQECGISSHEELTTALSFIHSRLGLVRYFNVKELDSIVVIDPQVLFDKITDLIVETFINEDVNVEQNEIEEFHEKGIISVAMMKKISESPSKGVQLPFKWLTALLNYLRIAARFKDHQGEKYFFPSALCHVPEADDSSSDSSTESPEPPANQPSPFLVAFETGFCPRGIAGALIKCLVTNEMKSSREWELLPKKIFRNEVTFHVEACGDVTIKVLPTHLEITIDSDNDSDCEEAYTQITKGMKIVSTMYKKCEFFCTFYCTLPKCKSNPHPGKIEWKQNAPFKLRCKVFNKTSALPSGYKLWNLHKWDVGSRRHTEVPYEHLGQLASCMVEWRGPIADQLKLAPNDVASVETKYPQKLNLQIREALFTWKQRNGSKATYSELIEIFEQAGYRSYADELRKIAELSDSEADDSSGSGEEQPKTYPTPHKGSVFSRDQLPSATPKTSEVYMMVKEENLPEGADIGEVCGEEVLVPQLTPSKSDSKRSGDHTDEKQSSKNTVKRDHRDLRMERDAAQLQPPDDSSGLGLHQASYRGEIDKVKWLIETQNVNPLQKDEYGDTALHYAAMGGDLGISKYLIEEQGLSPAYQGQHGRTCLHHAAEFNHLELVKYLVGEQQVDPLCKGNDGYTSLHSACLGGDVAIVQFLIKEIQKYMSLEDVLDERSKDGHTPFHLAALNGQLPVIKVFLSEFKFDANTPGFMGRPALHDAAQEGHLEVVQYLIEEAKCDPSCCPGEEKATPLHLAAQYGRLDVVRYLTLQHHSNPLSRNIHGNTPLHNAALHGHFNVVEFFTSELKCDANASGQWGRSPLHFACQGGSMDIVKYLIEQMNCNPSQLDEQQVTPLHMATMCGHLHLVKYLIQDKLCNPLCRDSNWDTPLHAAAQGGHLEVVQYYIETIQCSPNIRGWRSSPLELARSKGHNHIVNYLESSKKVISTFV